MTTLDILAAAAAILMLISVGFCYARRGGRTTNEFMLGGRRLPWWLAGTAMAAGNSSADSPLHQSGKIRRDGLPGAWFYWSQVFGQMFSALVFSRLWRRTGVTTVAEFYQIRYTGVASVMGRVWSMVFASFIQGTFGVALGLLAIIKMSETTFGLHEAIPVFGIAVAPGLLIALIAIALAASYAVVSGLMGVVAGDAVEFVFALACSYILTFYVYRATGYSAGLEAGLAQLSESGKLSFMPEFGFSAIVFFFFQPLTMMAGDNSVSQRYLALKDERQAMLSGVWRIINHYFLRCWPWYICGLCSLVLLGGFSHELAYPELIVRFLPSGVRGLMFGAFLVAFMGTVSTAMHTSGTLFVNDFYRSYAVRGASDRHYVWATRLTMIVFTGIATVIALSSDHILGLLQVLMKVLGAAGMVMLLRWFWWRVNGWADLSAQIMALPLTLLFENSARIFGATYDPVAFALRLVGGTTADDRFGVTFLLTVGTNTLLWIVVMLCTPPEPAHTLTAFFRRVRPYGWWGPVARLCPDTPCTDSLAHDLGLFLRGLVLALGLLFGLGLLLLGRFVPALVLLACGAAGGWSLVRGINDRHATPEVPVVRPVQRQLSPVPRD